jgi:hypothetical protein
MRLILKQNTEAGEKRGEEKRNVTNKTKEIIKKKLNQTL